MSNEIVKRNEIVKPEPPDDDGGGGPFRGRNIMVEQIDCNVGYGGRGLQTVVTLVAYGEDAEWLAAAAHALMKKQARGG